MSLFALQSQAYQQPDEGVEPPSAISEATVAQELAEALESSELALSMSAKPRRQHRASTGVRRQTIGTKSFSALTENMRPNFPDLSDAKLRKCIKRAALVSAFYARMLTENIWECNVTPESKARSLMRLRNARLRKVDRALAREEKKQGYATGLTSLVYGDSHKVMVLRNEAEALRGDAVYLSGCAAILQAWWRGVYTRRSLIPGRAAIPLQAAWRALQGRWRAARQFSAQYAKTLVSRTWEHGLSDKSKEKSLARLQLRSVRSIEQEAGQESRYFSSRRYTLNRRAEEIRMLMSEHRCILIQAWWRGRVVNRRVVPGIRATTIQKAWRAYVGRRQAVRQMCKRFVANLVSGVWQTELRRKPALKLLVHWRYKSINSLFQSINIYKLRRRSFFGSAAKTSEEIEEILGQIAKLKDDQEHRNVSITIVQAWWRGTAVRRIFVPGIHARTIQVVWREHQRRRHRAATKCQALWRGFSVRCYKLLEHLAVRCCADAVRSAHRLYPKAMLKSSAKLRSLEILRLKEKAYQESGYFRTSRSSVILQEEVQRLQVDEAHRCNCAILLQSWWRGCHARRRVIPGIHASCIQRAFRSRHQKRCGYACRLQTAWRQRQARFSTIKMAASRCASAAFRKAWESGLTPRDRVKVRAQLRVRKLRELEASAEREYRLYKYLSTRRPKMLAEMSALRDDKAFLGELAILLQSWWRGCRSRRRALPSLYAEKIQGVWRVRYARRVARSVKIQTAWRGRQARLRAFRTLVSKCVQQWTQKHSCALGHSRDTLKLFIRLRHSHIETIKSEVQTDTSYFSRRRSTLLAEVSTLRDDTEYHSQCATLLQANWRGCHARAKALEAALAKQATAGFQVCERSPSGSHLIIVVGTRHGINLRIPSASGHVIKVEPSVECPLKRWTAAKNHAMRSVCAKRLQAQWRAYLVRSKMVPQLAERYIGCVIAGVLRKTDPFGNQIFGMDPTQLQGFIETRIQQSRSGLRLEGRRSSTSDADDDVDVSESFVCPVCHMLMFKPIVTPCNHRFCKFCLLLWVETQQRSHVYEYIQDSCPMCRTGIDVVSLKPDKDLEQQIIAQYGVRHYHSRHCDMIAEKVERMIAHSSEEQREVIDEIHSSQISAFLAGARAGMVGTAVAGPVGLLVGFGIGFISPYIRRAQIQEMGKYGIVEDDTGIGDNKIQVVNTTLTPVRAYLYNVNGAFSLESVDIAPSTPEVFELDSIASPQADVFTLHVVRPEVLVDKELATTTVWRGRAYLFCCTDTVVRPATSHRPEEEASSASGLSPASSEQVRRSLSASSPLAAYNGDRVIAPRAPEIVQPVLVRSESSSKVELNFYSRGDRLCLFSRLQATLQPREEEAFLPANESETIFKVVVYNVEPRMELSTVEMERGKSYTIGDSRFHGLLQHYQEDEASFLEALLD